MDRPKRKCDTEAVAGLPDDPLVEILSRVPVKSLCRFKCVSKAWRDLIADPLHRKKLPHTLEGFFFRDEEHRDSDSYGFVDLLQGSVRPEDFSYLTELPGPGIGQNRLLQSCNGLLLFAVGDCSSHISESYIVSNPATKQSVAVPSSSLPRNQIFYGYAMTYLLYDPAGAPWHFNLVQISNYPYQKSVHVYSSKTQAWSQTKPDLAFYDITPYYPGVYANGMLHLISYSKAEVNVLDVEGNIHKTIPPPCQPCQAGKKKWTNFDYIGWSQGCLHYINHETPDDEEIEPSFHGLLIWVLEDYERQQWVLKYSISFSILFGETNVNNETNFAYDVVGIHPDHSSVFLVQFWDQKLISYHMDSKEVCVFCSLGHKCDCVTPYVPCFSELLALENKQSNCCFWATLWGVNRDKIME